MFSLFKRRDWKPELIPELQGECRGLIVRLRNFPCLVDPADGSRKLPSGDFGGDFLAELTDRQLGDFGQLRAALSVSGTRTVAVQLKGLAPIEMDIAGQPPSTAKEFYSDLADAIIAALQSKGIKP